MGGEADQAAEPSSIPRLPLLPVPQIQSPQRPGTLTPPLHTSAAVPFLWEDEPGKPRPCTALIPLTDPPDLAHKCLELPPRLLSEALLPSPTTVLEGPYVGRPRFQSSSFRMGKECYGSFSPPDAGQIGTLVQRRGRMLKRRGWFGSWRKKVCKGKTEVSTGGSYVFPFSADRASGTGSVGDGRDRKIRRVGSFSGLSQAKYHFWTRIREGLKEVISWRSKKFKKDGNGIKL